MQLIVGPCAVANAVPHVTCGGALTTWRLVTTTSPVSDVTRVLSEHHVNILSATVSTSNDRLALSKFVFEMGDTTHLDRVLNAVRRIDAVYDVYRVTSS